jgi:anti-anti-sigma factor
MGVQFSVEVRGSDRATVVAVRGELDIASSPELEDALARVSEWGTELVILDLRELDFMDSTGLQVLVKAHQRAKDGGPRFAAVKGGPQVQRLLSMTGMDERMMLVDAPDGLGAS